MTEPVRPKIGLALGSGAARGCSHIGVLDALHEARVPIDYIAGTSIGSLVGAAYASGKLDSLRESLLQMDWKEILSYFFELSRPRGGFIDGKRVAQFIGDFIEDTDMENLPIPFRAVATDIHDGSVVVLDRGPVMEAIRASISIPGVFTPVTRNGRVLVDGGLVNPVPVDVVRDMGADYIIAVDINHGQAEAHAKGSSRSPEPSPGQPEEGIELSREWADRVKFSMQRRLDEWDQKIKGQVKKWWSPGPVPSIVDVLGNTIRIAETQIGAYSLKLHRPDILIQPDVGKLNFMDFHRAEEAIEAGYVAAKEALADFPAEHKEAR